MIDIGKGTFCPTCTSRVVLVRILSMVLAVLNLVTTLYVPIEAAVSQAVITHPPPVRGNIVRVSDPFVGGEILKNITGVRCESSTLFYWMFYTANFTSRFFFPFVSRGAGNTLDAWGSNPCCPSFNRNNIGCPPASCPITSFNSSLPAVPFWASVKNGKCDWVSTEGAPPPGFKASGSMPQL